MLLTFTELGIDPGNIEKLPSKSLPFTQLSQPIIHKGPDIGKKKADWSSDDIKKARQHVLDEVLELDRDTPFAFTDGSALGNPGPCGGAAVVFPGGLAGEPIIIKTPCSRYGSNYIGELWGLLLALMSVALEVVPLPQAYHIFTDCTSAIQCTVSRAVTGCYETVDDIREVITFLCRHACQVHLHWTPSHIGFELNEFVDQAAKEAAEEAKSGDGKFISICQGKRAK